MDKFYQIVLLSILACIMELYAASFDIEVKINMDQNGNNNGRKFHVIPDKPNVRARTKNHFLHINPDIDFISETDHGDPKTHIITRSAINDDDDEDPTYPYEKIKQYVKANPHLLKYFTPAIPLLGNRGGEVEELGENVCNSKKDPYYQPTKLNNTRGQMKTIINDNDHKQYVEREICIRGGSNSCHVDHLGMKSTCVQQYTTIRLVVFNDPSDVGHKDDIDAFKIPTCCACRLFPE